MSGKKQKPLGRGAGVLLPVFCLPSDYGIGAFGREAYDFVDFLAQAGQRYWQVLPLGPTSYGDSPYQSFSAFGGNPYFIDLNVLIERGLLRKEEAQGLDWGLRPDWVDYEKLYAHRFLVLKKVWFRSGCAQDADFRSFCAENKAWLEEYALFMALKDQFGGREWQLWPEEIRLRQPEAIRECRERLNGEIEFWQYVQYLFFAQWSSLKAYANRKGISIIGDIPIYVAMDSADVWVNGSLFQLDDSHHPTAVAGVPPDLFSSTGQLWGNPLYDWQAMERDGFSWWKARMSASAALYDLIRIDHFIGIVNYYSIPAGEETALNGRWMQGPGEKLLNAIGPALGSKRIIAEDLGVVTPAVRRLLRRTGYPGMKLMEFAFDSDSANENLPCYFDKNLVAYGGTHDNETLAGFFGPGQSRKMLRFARRYLNVSQNVQIPWALIRAGYASCADTVVFQLQDFLGLENHARINTPSTLGGNWCWRLTKGQLHDDLAVRIRELAELYGRCR
ncbi:MAG: 4-alpha-glucanotransferase [Oscillospiraceae bacterium]|nr:4-alpha-glucanotransferase [Oscillospiraceae bacterium]